MIVILTFKIARRYKNDIEYILDRYLCDDDKEVFNRLEKRIKEDCRKESGGGVSYRIESCFAKDYPYDDVDKLKKVGDLYY